MYTHKSVYKHIFISNRVVAPWNILPAEPHHFSTLSASKTFLKCRFVKVCATIGSIDCLELLGYVRCVFILMVFIGACKSYFIALILLSLRFLVHHWCMHVCCVYFDKLNWIELNLLLRFVYEVKYIHGLFRKPHPHMSTSHSYQSAHHNFHHYHSHHLSHFRHLKLAFRKKTISKFPYMTYRRRTSRTHGLFLRASYSSLLF